MDSVQWSLIALAVLTVLAVAWSLIARLRRGPRLPYAKRLSLLTAAELRFYRALLQAIPPGLMVFVKVRLMGLVSVPDGAWPSHGTRGSGMHVDFVLADASTIGPRLVIELDDSSHARP